MSQSGPPPPYPGGAEGAQGYPPANPGYPQYDAKTGGPPPAAYGVYSAYGPPPPTGPYPGQPMYGQPPYGQPAYGQPAYGQPVQPGYAPSGQATTVVVTQPTVAVVQTFRESPVHTRCPHCQAEIVSATHYETGTFTWIICLILCLVGCDFGCCLIPFCVDGCKDVIHSCPNCRQQVARWSRM